MDIQLVRGNTLHPSTPTSWVIRGEGKHSFQKILEEKTGSKKDIFIKSEQVEGGKLTQSQKDELRKKYDITNLGYYSDDADKLFGTLRDLGVISEEEYMKTGNAPAFADVPSKSNGMQSNGMQSTFGGSHLDANSNLYLNYRNLAAEHSADYAEVGYEFSKKNADFNKKISQALYDVFMS